MEANCKRLCDSQAKLRQFNIYCRLIFVLYTNYLFSVWRRNVCFENSFKFFVKVILGIPKVEKFLYHIRANLGESLGKMILIHIMLTCSCNIDPLTSHFDTKLGFTGVYIFLFVYSKTYCGYSYCGIVGTH